MHQSVAAWFDGLGTGTKFNLHMGEGNFDHGRRIAFEAWAGFDLRKGLASFDQPHLTEGMGQASAGLAGDVIRESRSLARSAEGGS